MKEVRVILSEDAEEAYRYLNEQEKRKFERFPEIHVSIVQ